MNHYNFPDCPQGNTISEVTFELQINSLPVDLTSATVKLFFNNAGFSKELSVENGGLEIIDASAGKIKVVPTVINWPVATYRFFMQITLPTGAIKNIIHGKIDIIDGYLSC